MPKLSYDQYPFDSKSQIRLLKFDRCASGPWQWSFTQPITIRPDHKAEAACRFIAASYEWGPPDSTASFTIDGKETTLRCNLVQFLQTLSERPNLDNITPAYWIDSICINQDDQQEKADQIGLLREIYSSASCVLSWLGPMGDGSNLAMKYLSGVNIAAEESVNALLNRRYWTRIWMVQEVVLGRKWYLACGTDVIDGDEMTRRLNPPNSRSSRRASQWKESKAYDLIRERLNFQTSGRMALVDLMLRFYKLNSTHMVDKIRALLALSKPDTIGNIHELLTRFDNPTGDHDQVKMVIQDLCHEICRLAGLEESKNVSFFVEGLLLGGILPQILEWAASNLQCHRMSIQKSPLPTDQLSGPTESPPLPTTVLSRPIKSKSVRSDAVWKSSDLARFSTEGQHSFQRRIPVASALGRTTIPYQPSLKAPVIKTSRPPLEPIHRQVAQIHPNQKPPTSKKPNVARLEGNRIIFAVPDDDASIFRSQTPLPKATAPEIWIPGFPLLPTASEAPNEISPPKLRTNEAAPTPPKTSRSVSVQDGVVKKKGGQLVLQRKHGTRSKREKAEKKKSEEDGQREFSVMFP
jgi:hypothetical protein